MNNSATSSAEPPPLPRPHQATAADLPQGFRWSAAAAEIRYTGRNDLTLLVADQPAAAAAVFTRNTFAAPPVHLSRQILRACGGRLRGVITNSGCANAATGEQGLANARAMAEGAARAAGLPPEAPGSAFLVCSTGTIGVQLPMEKIEAALPGAVAALANTPEAFHAFARGILTTDLVEKTAAASFTVDGKAVRIVGCAKGSGMIHPQMATMLAYVATDADVEPDHLQKLFSEAIERSINCVTVDGDTSTNDTAILLASGASGVPVRPGTPVEEQFQAALLSVLRSLARQLARDGEGATRLIEIEVSGAPDFFAARRVGLMIGNSPLVKTAVYGRDANWGRIAMAAGNSGVAFDPSRVTIRLGPLTLFADGAPLPLDEEAALAVLSQETVRIKVDLAAGPASATVWTCDLTEKYIEINGSYRT